MTRRQFKHTKQFRRDYKKMQRSGRGITKLDAVMEILIDGQLLPPQYKDHSLCGEWLNKRDCHIEGDWLLVYELGFNKDGNETVIFHATDTHENLFG